MIPDFYLEREEYEIRPDAEERFEDSDKETRKGMRNLAPHGLTITKRSGSSTRRLPARFAFAGELGDVLLRHLQRDANDANLSAKFRLYYRFRSMVPLMLRHLLQRGRNRGLPVDSNWYVPEEFLKDFQNALRSTNQDRLVIHPWPDKHEMSCVLTHDVETQEGMRRIFELAELEEEYGLRSAWNIIPYKYEVDPGMIRELKNRGHEVSVHGFNHDGRLFESRSVFESRTPGINAAIEQYDAQGFRAPMVHRNLLWLQDLDIDYDASCFDVDPFQAMPGGVGGVWPFFAGKFVELPYTLPQDHTLFVALGQDSPDIWIEKFEWISRLRGMALLVTHPDYLNTAPRLDAYRQFLEYIVAQRSRAWLALPAEVAKWWRQRDGMEIVADDVPQIVGSAADRASLQSLGRMFTELSL